MDGRKSDASNGRKKQKKLFLNRQTRSVSLSREKWLSEEKQDGPCYGCADYNLGKGLEKQLR